MAGKRWVCFKHMIWTEYFCMFIENNILNCTKKTASIFNPLRFACVDVEVSPLQTVCVGYI